MHNSSLEINDKNKISSPKKGRPREFNREKALFAALKVFWEKGFECATLPDLCNAMGIKPPSLYGAFGNKADLFLEALQYYENTFWSEPSKRFMENPNLRDGVDKFFQETANIILSPNSPCGCMVVVAAVNITSEETKIINEINRLRQGTRDMFVTRLRKAIQQGQIPADADVPAIANALNTFLEGMSLQAKGGLFLSELKAIGRLATNLLPEMPQPVRQ